MSNNWTREELILSLSAYHVDPKAMRNGNSPQARDLSRILRKLGTTYHGSVPANYRSPSSVSLRTSKWQAMNVEYVDEQHSGLDNAGILAREVYHHFEPRLDLLHRSAATLKSSITHLTWEPAASMRNAQLPDHAVEASEGRLLSVRHFKRERKPELARQKKCSVLSAGAPLECEVCSMSFAKVFGDHGDGFIEVHHRVPLSEYVSETITSLDDLALVCANCHRMLHWKRPWLSIAELRSKLEDVSAGV